VTESENPTAIRAIIMDLKMSDFQMVLGTGNAKKKAELQRLLAPYPQIQLTSLADYPAALEVEETGITFAENAELKASVQARHLNRWVLAEDSGISVDALDGAPGIYSARFSGEKATDTSNNEMLLEKLTGVPSKKRTAFYTCHMALSDPEGTIHIRCEDKCHGRILTKGRGNGGFGYDPLFEIPEYHATFGELGPSVKSVLSHRARANRRFVPLLLTLIDSMKDQ
jgi:XTP/dITP diphosphohydrolase